MSYPIGIDLGTTYSCVGVYMNEKVEIIANEQGNRTTPSYVAFTGTERIIGEAAKNQIVRNPENTVFDVKRLIGRDFRDSTVQADMRLWPFRVVQGIDKKPMILVSFKGRDELFYPEQISTMVLMKMKKIAEIFIGQAVKDAVVTVPAYFNDSQRQATKDAGLIAGLNVLSIINEPTAAAIAYGFDKIIKNERNVLIFDLGGGTLDVSLLTIKQGQLEVKATAGDMHLGGEDFDNRLMAYCALAFKKTSGFDITNDHRALRRLRTQCEKAKRMLSNSNQAIIEVDCLKGGEDFLMTITRAKFEELNMDYFLKCLLPVELVLKDSGFSKAQINDIVLVGGSTRIPKVQELLKDLFNGRELNKSINPDEAVAYGAAIQAAILTNQYGENLKDILLIEVVPLSLGIEIYGGYMHNVIARGQRIPARETKVFSTFVDNQSGVDIKVFEGERPMTKDNRHLGTFKLEGIPPAPKGILQIEIAFELDSDGILKLSAFETFTGNVKSFTIANDKGRLNSNEIERLISEAQKFKDEDELIQQCIEAKNNLEQFIYNIRHKVSDDRLKDKITEEKRNQIIDVCTSTEAWIISNPNAHLEEIDTKKKELKAVYNPIISKIYEVNGKENTQGVPHGGFTDNPQTTNGTFCNNKGFDITGVD